MPTEIMTFIGRKSIVPSHAILCILSIQSQLFKTRFFIVVEAQVFLTHALQLMRDQLPFRNLKLWPCQTFLLALKIT